MKKVLALACVTSVLALASGANAQSYSVTLNGSVPATCKVTGATITGGLAGSSADTSSATVNFDLSSGNEVTGYVLLAYDANSQCNFSIASTYGALKNTAYSGTDPKPTLSYSAGMGRWPGDGVTPVTGATTFMYFNALATGVQSKTLYVGWDIGAHGPLAAGTYTDTLTVTITPVA